MKHPVVDLKLNPSSRKQIQRSSRLEPSLLSRHKSLTDQPRIRCPKLLLGRHLTVLSWEVAAKAHS